MQFKMITRALVAGAVLSIGTTAISRAEEYRLADFLPPTHPYQEQVWGVMGDMISEATDGEVTLKVFPGGALGANPVEQYDRAQNGVAEFAFGLPGYTASKFPITLLSELPGMMEEETANEQLWGAIDILREEYPRIQLFSIFPNAQNLLFSRETPIRSLADIEGMKIRVPSANAGAMVEEWGGVPVSMPIPEIYNALQTGVIDAVLTDATATYAFRFGEVTKYLTHGMAGTRSPLAVYMNKDAYEALSPEHQAEFDRIGREVAVIANGVQLSGAERGLQMFAEMEDHEVIELTPEAAAEFDAASERAVEAVLAQAEADGLPAREFADALRK